MRVLLFAILSLILLSGCAMFETRLVQVQKTQDPDALAQLLAFEGYGDERNGGLLLSAEVDGALASLDSMDAEQVQALYDKSKQASAKLEGALVIMERFEAQNPGVAEKAGTDIERQALFAAKGKMVSARIEMGAALKVQTQVQNVSAVNATGAGQAPADSDGDGWADVADNCPNAKNAKQEDEDLDGIGSVCDPEPLSCEEWCASQGYIEVLASGNLTQDACGAMQNSKLGSVQPGTLRCVDIGYNWWKWGQARYSCCCRNVKLYPCQECLTGITPECP